MHLQLVLNNVGDRFKEASFWISLNASKHLLNTCSPRWYSLLPNLDSLISMVFPGPPIGSEWVSSILKQTSLAKLFHSLYCMCRSWQLTPHWLLSIFVHPVVSKFFKFFERQMWLSKPRIFLLEHFLPARFIAAS